MRLRFSQRSAPTPLTLIHLELAEKFCLSSSLFPSQRRAIRIALMLNEALLLFKIMLS